MYFSIALLKFLIQDKTPNSVISSVYACKILHPVFCKLVNVETNSTDYAWMFCLTEVGECDFSVSFDWFESMLFSKLCFGYKKSLPRLLSQ